MLGASSKWHLIHLLNLQFSPGETEASNHREQIELSCLEKEMLAWQASQISVFL